jgi:hypothetical protein
MDGHTATLHHDSPWQIKKEANSIPIWKSVSAGHFRKEEFAEAFITYMSGWKRFADSVQHGRPQAAMILLLQKFYTVLA